MKGVKAQKKKTFQNNVWFATLSPRQQDLLLLRLCEARQRSSLTRAYSCWYARTSVHGAARSVCTCSAGPRCDSRASSTERNIVHAHGMISQILDVDRLAVRSRVRGGGAQADEKKDALLCVFLNPRVDWSHATSASQKTLPTLTPSSKVCWGARSSRRTLALVRARTRTNGRSHARAYACTYVRTYVYVCVRAVPCTVSRGKWTRTLMNVCQISSLATARGMCRVRSCIARHGRAHVHMYVRT